MTRARFLAFWLSGAALFAQIPAPSPFPGGGGAAGGGIGGSVAATSGIAVCGNGTSNQITSSGCPAVASAAINLTDFNPSVVSNVFKLTFPVGGTNFGCGGVTTLVASGLVVSLATPTAASAANAYIYYDCVNQRIGFDTASGLTGITPTNATLGNTGVSAFPGNGFIPIAIATAGATANTWAAASTAVDSLSAYSALNLLPGSNISSIPCDSKGTCTINAAASAGGAQLLIMSNGNYYEPGNSGPATTYVPPGGNAGNAQTTESVVEIPFNAGVISNQCWMFVANAPSATDSVVFTFLDVTASTSGVVVTIPATATAGKFCSSGGDTLSVSAGDLVVVQVVSTSSTQVYMGSGSATFTP